MGLTAEEGDAVGGDPLVRAALGASRPRTHAGPDLLGAGVRRLALAPFTAENGRQVVIGVGRLYDEEFDAAELALLEAVAESVGHALERTWLAAERDLRAGRQAALARAATALSSTLVRHDVLRTLSDEVAAALHADLVAVFATEDSGQLDLVAVTGELAQPVQGPALESLLHAEVMRTGELLVHQPSSASLAGELPGAGRLRSAVAAPIRPHGRVEGVVLAGYHGDRWIEREEADLLAAFGELAGIAWRNAADHAAVQEAAARDSLTGCLNHGAFQDRLRAEIARAARDGGSLAIALMDLNDFKAVNDTHGHLVGDALLRGVADALRASVRPYDQVARYGGDEFALLLPATDQEAARRVVDRALAAVAGVRVPGDGGISATAGVAHWRDEEPANALIARADRALLETKRARGRGRRGPAGEGDEPARPDGQRERQRLRRLATAGSVGTRLARLLDQRAIAETAIIELGAALGYDRCALVRREEGGAVVVVAAASAEEHSAAEAATVTEALRRSVRERRTVLVGDLGDEPGGAELAVPVHVAGTLWGAIGVRSSGPAPFDEDDAQLVQSLADHLGTALRTAELYDQLERTHLGTAEALAAALEAKDHYTADHARSIADLAVAVGDRLGLDEDSLRDLRYGAIFHDIGKIAIPDAILNKPAGLTEDEFAIVRRHPEVGEQILAPVPLFAGVRRIVRHDHERWDGRGYPDGLRGSDIPIGARIVLVVDAYHAMRSDRPYRRAMPVAEAREQLRQHAGSQFDPRVVDALLSVLERDPAAEPA
jgi:diguanylate cyclase (GGDEF)-like protein